MVWIVLLVLLVAIFGLGTLLEAAFWTLVVAAVIVVALGVLASRVIAR